MTSYSYAERDKAYAVIERVENLRDLVEAIGQGREQPNKDLQAVLADMTGATDLHRQHEALKYLHKQIYDGHRKRIIEASRDDFSCFVEAINPDEACRSQVHRFLSECFMKLEVEPDQKMALSMPPGHAKDLCIMTPVLMADGSSKRLKDVEVGDFVITHTGKAREVLEVHDQGIRETIMLETMFGRMIRTHPDHPFLTPAGWTPAKDLVVGDTLAQQREFSIRNESGRKLNDFILAGYFLAYGVVTNRAYSRMDKMDRTFRCNDPDIIHDITELARKMKLRHTVNKWKSYGEYLQKVDFEEPMQFWLMAQEMWDIRRKTMRIPEWVFKGSAIEIGAFLGAIFSMDAKTVPGRSKHTGAQTHITLKTRNPGLMKDFRRLLMRIGVRACLRRNLENCYNYEPTNFWTLSISEAEDILFLKKSLRIVGRNAKYWDEHINVRRFFDYRYAEDKVIRIHQAEPTHTKCLTVEFDHSFLADGIVVHNSTYGSRLFPAWWLGRRENKKWLQAGHTQRFAEKEFGKKFRDNIISTKGWSEVFPDVMLRASSQDEILLSNDCSYVVKGVGQGISGYRSHFNNIDDPYPTEKSAQSPVYRESTWHWFTNDFRTRRLPGAGELIIVTRWHSDDIVGRLEEKIAEGEIEPWEIINLPAFSLGEDVDILKRPKNYVLWPEFFTSKYLLDIKGGMLESRWQSLYQGSPTIADGNILKRRLLKYYNLVPQKLSNSYNKRWDPKNFSTNIQNLVEHITGREPSKFFEENSNPVVQNPYHAIRTVVSVDSAEKDTARADFTSILVWIYASDKKHYLVDRLNEKLEFPDLVKQIEHMATKWGADAILIETKGAGNQYIQARTGHAPCSIIGFNPGRDDKAMRFEGTLTMWQAGEVLLPERAPWLEAYTDQLLRFPTGKNDDDVDATSQYLNWSRADGGWKRGTKKLNG